MTIDHLRSNENNVKDSLVSHRWKTVPTWAFLSLAANGLLLLLLIWLLRDYWLPIDSQLNASTTRENLMRELPASSASLGPRHRLSYDKWVAILQQEAKVAAENAPENLTILAGDSLSLWFPTDLLPSGPTWLNQGISGEVSAGLLQRLKLFDHTKPNTIFVMIGINDLIRGVPDQDLLWNYRLIVRRLRRIHPESTLVIQSILPHGGEESTWEGRDRLLSISNQRIQDLNQNLERIAEEENAKFFDLYFLFTDDRGYLRPEFTTDGLHLSRQGYLVWRSALIVYDRKLKQEQENNEREKTKAAQEEQLPNYRLPVPGP